MTMTRDSEGYTSTTTCFVKADDDGNGTVATYAQDQLDRIDAEWREWSYDDRTHAGRTTARAEAVAYAKRLSNKLGCEYGCNF